jgi:hypothetical protein
MKYLPVSLIFYRDEQSFLNFLRILNRLEVGVFDWAVKFESPCIIIFVMNNSKIFKNKIKKVNMQFNISNFFTIGLVALSAPITRLLKCKASVVSVSVSSTILSK